MDLDSKSNKSSSVVAPMDLDSESDKSSSAVAAIEEERPMKKLKYDRRFASISDSDEYRLRVLNRYPHLDRFEQRMCLLAACSTVYYQELEFQWSRETVLSKEEKEEVKALVLKKAEMIGEDASALHAHIRKQGWQPCILNDDIRHEIIKGSQDYRMRMQAADAHRRALKLENKSDDQGACSVTMFHQSDDQKRKEILVKKATEKRFPDFVW